MSRRPLSVLLQVLLALGSFAGGVLLIRPLVPYAEGGELYAKREYFDWSKDHFNALYFGSSRVLRGLDTRKIDEIVTAAGLPMRSFNFGAAGTWAFEQDYLLQEVLKRKPKHVRWIFYAGRPVGSESTPHHAFDTDPDLRSARGVQWHTPRQTLFVLQAVRRMPDPLGTKLGLAATHLELLARNLTNLGRGPAIFARRFETREARLQREGDMVVVHEGLGNAGLEDLHGRPHDEVMEEVWADPQAYYDWVARIPEENARELDLDTIHVGVYAEQLRAANELGIELIYFTAPGLEGSPERLRLHEAEVLPTVFHFNDPERYPELFRAENRFDRGHLNRRGSDLWSERFAEVLLEHLAGAPEFGVQGEAAEGEE